MTEENKRAKYDKSIDWKDAKDIGLLMRINREFLFPMGLAITVDLDTNTSPIILVSPSGSYEYPEDIEQDAIKAKSKGDEAMYEDAKSLSRYWGD